MKPLVSILMPAYNAEPYIGQAIDSIIKQEYAHFELLIADDGSTDNTAVRIAAIQDERIRVFHNGNNQGVIATLNKLLAYSKGDYITIQDADDWSDPYRLIKQVAALNADSELGLCGTWARYYTPDGLVLREKRTPVADAAIKEGIVKQNQFCSASVMIRRAVYEKIGGQQPYFAGKGNADYDWTYRMVQQFKASNLAEALYFVRTTPNSLSRSVKSPWQLESHKLVQWLAKQRELSGTDALMSGDQLSLAAFEQSLLAAYQTDASLLWRRAADIAAYNKDVKGHRHYAAKAFRARPSLFLNCKYLIGSLLKR